MLESDYQARVIRLLKHRFNGCFVLKNDTTYIQGIPDLLVLYRNYWAMLEVKASLTAAIQPNQLYYITLFDEMSFAAFISPEVEEEVLDALQQAFGFSRPSRFSKS